MTTSIRWSLVGGAAACLVAVGCEQQGVAPHQDLPSPEHRAVLESIDWDALLPGTVVTEVYGSAGSGPVTVYGVNPYLGSDVNAAVVFNSAAPTGGDWDLGTPNETCGGPGRGAGGEVGSPYENCEPLYNVLIIDDTVADADGDGLVDDPDDVDETALDGVTIDLDFSAIGTVTMHELRVLDIDGNAPDPRIELYGAEGVLASYPIPNDMEDNGTTVVDLGDTAGVVRMFIHLQGSGAIDGFFFTADEDEETGDEGCTPGFWKNHPAAWQGFSPDQTVASVFSEAAAYAGIGDATLMGALRFGGGPGATGGAKIMLRAAVAAILNAASDEVMYPRTLDSIFDDVNAALASGHRGQMIGLGSELDIDNNLGCPTNGRPDDDE
jgi:hypothetical protein